MSKPFLARFPSLPPEAQSIYDAARAEGADKPDPDGFALCRLNHAGWYLSDAGWAKLGPDVRDKVNVRSPVMQPNGKYLIAGVPVFYPNAVKTQGKDKRPDPFTAQRVSNILDNTNRAIAAGAPKPALTRRHPKENDLFPTDIYGRAVNFKAPSDGGTFSTCDLVDVSPAMIAAWRGGQVVGLSPGINQDGNGLNQRIGHIAALTKAQALSALPATELFQADSVQLAFSAEQLDIDDTGASQTKGAIPMASPKYHAAMKSHFGAMSSAFSALAAGEPGAEDKMNEAHQQFCTAHAKFAAENPDEASDTELFKKLMAEEKGGQTAVPPKLEEKPAGEYEADVAAEFDAEAFTADPVGWARKLHNSHREQAKTVTTLAAENASLKQREVEAVKAASRAAFQSFCAEHADLAFSADDSLALYDAAGGGAPVVEKLKSGILKAPKKVAPGPADVQFFSAEDIEAIRPAKENKPAPTSIDDRAAAMAAAIK